MHQSKIVSPPIVCGVDGSDESRNALREAARLAEALDARLEIVMAWEHSTSMYDAYFPEPGRSPKVVAYGVLQELAREQFGEALPEWVTVRAEPGHAGAVLVAAAEGAAMLVVGCRGRSGLASPFLGSVSLYCTTQAPCPVLVVRPASNGNTAAHTTRQDERGRV
ncbi:universal stress protein [Leifsonia poae]|uniref:universal stress protein n=1 Tax=Leifsonia poae TaxID=110933 RepID=UPI003D6859F9